MVIPSNAHQSNQEEPSDEEVGRAWKVLKRAEASIIQPTIVQSPTAAVDTTQLTKTELAKALKVAKITIERSKFTPSFYVGNSPRFDLDSVRNQLAFRGRQSTKAPKVDPNADPIDVSAAARSGGLRAIK